MKQQEFVATAAMVIIAIATFFTSIILTHASK